MTDTSESPAPATPGEGIPRVRKVTFVDEDDPFRVASSTRPPIARMSSNAWVSARLNSNADSRWHVVETDTFWSCSVSLLHPTGLD